MWTIITILAIVIGVVGHLFLIGLCFAGMPNSAPRQMAEIKRWMSVVGAVAVVVAGAGIGLLRAGHPLWGAALNIVSPVVMFVVLLTGSKP
jgi:hypothetical protein